MGRPNLQMLRTFLATTALRTTLGVGVLVSPLVMSVPHALAQSQPDRPASEQLSAPPADKVIPPPADTPEPAAAVTPSAPAAAATEAAPQPAVTVAIQPPVPDASPLLVEVRRHLADLRASDAETGALSAFYAKRSGDPLWVGEVGFTPRAIHVMAELARQMIGASAPRNWRAPTLAPGTSDTRISRSHRDQARPARPGSMRAMPGVVASISPA